MTTQIPAITESGVKHNAKYLRDPSLALPAYKSVRRSSTLLESISIVQGLGEEERLIQEESFRLQRKLSVCSARHVPLAKNDSYKGLTHRGSLREKRSTVPPHSPGPSIRRGVSVTPSSPCHLKMHSSENLQYSRCGSKQSLLDTHSHRSGRLSNAGLEAGGGNANGSRSPDPSSNHQHHYVSMPSGPSGGNNTPGPAHTGGDASHRAPHSGRKHSQPHPHGTRSGPGHGHAPNAIGPGGGSSSGHEMIIMNRRQRHERKKDIQKMQWDKHQDRCHWSFVFDPAGRLCYYWSMVVSLAFLYNFWVIIFRFAFAEITVDTIVIWFSLDYLMDLIYLLDIVFHFRTGYLEDGVLQTDSTKLRQHYMNSTTFYIDCLCLLPLDFLYLSLGFKSILRIFRLVKVYQFWAFMDRSERHTNYPNLLRFFSLVHYLLLAFHWNSCLFHLLFESTGFGSEDVNSPWSELRYPVEGDSVMTYFKSFYWTMLSMTTIGDLPQPRTKGEYLFVIWELIVGLLTFATVLGYIANIVTNVSAARKDFQAKLDGVKTYMRLRRVPTSIQNKVIKWFDYLWLTQKSSDEEKAISCLPDKLKGEIAIHVHLDTLKRVEIFQNTEAGFLCELVLRLIPVLFSPGDYICRKGEVGKEMYICARGRLEVVADEGKTILATLKAGSYFGEISILNMGTAGNRRTASVRSVGYSDLFVLSKKDMWDVLKDYPAARVRLEAIAVKRLEKYKKAPLEKAALPRSESTPGLVESKGMVPLEDMWVSPMPLYTPATSPDSNSRAVTRSAADSSAHNLHGQPASHSHSHGGGPKLQQQSESPLSELSSNRSLAHDHAGAAGAPVTPVAPQVVVTNNSHQGHCASSAVSSRRPSGVGNGSFSCTSTMQPLQPCATLSHPLQQQPPSHSQHPLQTPQTAQPQQAASISAFAPPIPTCPQQQHHQHYWPQQHQHHTGHSAIPPFNGGSMSSSEGLLLSDQSTAAQQSACAFQSSYQQALQPSSSSAGASKPEAPKEELLLEIRRLKSRIRDLESDNASMNTKLSKTQKEVDKRLNEIEMHIQEDELVALATDDEDRGEGMPLHGEDLSSVSCSINSGEEEERNRESFI